ncbi:MAG: tetratricopeptide repeat protein, partial [Asticcacaulis sp.]
GLRDTHVCAEAFNDASNRASAELTCAHVSLALGELKAGWRWYEGRHKRGTPQEVHYDIALPRWRNEALAGARLFVSAEQGLGDEVLFASLLPDFVRDVGSGGHIGIGVEPRLVPLFQRSFPAAEVVPHHTRTEDGRTTRRFPELEASRFDRWALMGDFLPRLRGDIRAFPASNIFLTPDPARIAHWRGRLSAMGTKPKIGILWKSLKSSALRDRAFSAFDQWRDVLSLDAFDFINLQYGDIDAEIAQAREAGIRITTLDGIDLKQDLDDLASLCRALDVVIGPSNATTNIAGACGANLWLLNPPNAWAQLGQPNYPWYPQARVFSPPTVKDWSPAMAEIRQALLEL